MNTVDIYYDGKLIQSIVMYRNETPMEAINRVKLAIVVCANVKLESK